MLVVNTTRFGRLEIEPGDQIVFPEGLLGLSELTNFILIPHTNPESPVRWLQAVQDPDMAFAVMDPALIKADYEVRLTAGDLKKLDVEREDQAEVAILAIINATNPTTATINLLAPLCLCIDTRRGIQTVQHNRGLSARHTLRMRASSGDRKVA